VAARDNQDAEQTEDSYSPLALRNSPAHYDYKLYNGENHCVRAALSSKASALPARVCLIYDNAPLQGFYHAHSLFSVKKVLTILHGKVPYREIRQLIGEACTP